MTEYKFHRKVLRIGARKTGSLVVVLPKVWTQAHNVEQGDKIIVAFSANYAFLKITPIDKTGDNLKDEND